jgi:FlaA1/EpsC-like NDP-sugar epimerase
VLDPRFVFLAVALSVFGSASYVRDTLRGTTSPHRVTWGLWAFEGILAFIVEVQQHVGLASLMTLALGLVPLVILFTSFKNPHAVWKIDAVDVACGVVSLLGLVFWATVNESTVALVSFVAADFIAAVPTYRKSWRSPESETPRAFVMGAVNTGITLLTLKEFTTAGALFPGVIMMTDSILSVLILTRLGPRLAQRAAHKESLA